jgi:hypothetical protein
MDTNQLEHPTAKYWNGNNHVEVFVLGECEPSINASGEIIKRYRVRLITSNPHSTFTVDRQMITPCYIGHLTICDCAACRICKSLVDVKS